MAEPRRVRLGAFVRCVSRWTGRIGGIALALVALYWLGQALGPRNAVATVYSTETTPLSSVLLEQPPQPGGQRLLVVNGNTAYLEISTTDVQPDELVDRLASGVPERAPVSLEWTSFKNRDRAVDELIGIVQANSEMAMGPIAPEDLAHSRSEAAIAALRAEFAAAVGRPFKTSGDGWAAYGHVSPGGVRPLEAGSEDTFVGRFVLAMRPEGQRHTTIWNLRMPRDFDLSAWLPRSRGDVPGGDPSVLARYPASRRSFSLVETSLTGRSEIVVFDGGGTIGDHVRHYVAEGEMAGLHAIRSPDRQSENELIHMVGSQREITVFVSRAGRRVRDVIQVRTSSE